MKITILHGSNDNYGASRVLVTEVKVLEKLGHEVIVCVPSNGPLQELIANSGARAIVSVEPHLSVLRKARISDFKIFDRPPRAALDADLVVLWTLALVGYLPYFEKRQRACYVSVHEQLQGRLGRVLIWFFLKKSMAPVVACSQSVAAWLRNEGVAEKRIHVAYPVLEMGKLPLQWKQYSRDQPFKIAVVGRVNGRKGHLELVRVMKIFSSETENWELILAGGPFPGQERHLEDLLAEIQGDPRITYVGEIESFDLISKKVDVIASFPTKPEPFGLVPLEAWMNGIPSIGYSDGGAGEVFKILGSASYPRGSGDLRAIYSALDEIRQKMEAGHIPFPRDSVVSSFSLATRTNVVEKAISLSLSTFQLQK